MELQPDGSYRFSGTAADTTSAPVLVPLGPRDAVVIVTPGSLAGNDAKVQYSISTVTAVEDGTATWHDWPAGVITTKTSDSIAGAVTALRLVSTGSSAWEISK